MKYQSKSVKNFLDGIADGEYLLPAMQRDYVWKESQIIRLMDSLMRNFPTGTLLLWSNPSGDMYKFIQNYTKAKENEKASMADVSKASFGVLDGQQRLTSLYIAFCGTLKGKKLYFNISSSETDGDTRYEFAFLNENETENSEKKWVAVEEICSYEKKPSDSTCKKIGATNEIERENIKTLYSAYAECTLSYYEYENDNLSDILEIFIRVNSGGEGSD